MPKWVENQGIPENSTADYQTVKCSIWIYSIINILLVVVTLQQQIDREKEIRRYKSVLPSYAR